MRKTKETAPITTILGVETAVEGSIAFTGTVRLDGRVSGKIESQTGTVIIGEKAVIEADISVGVAIIMGRVKGVIDAANRIEIYPPAQVDGDIQSPVISIDAGVQFNGKCTMKPRGTTLEKNLPPFGSREAEAGGKVKNFPKNL
ncbi:MAG: polymer-forming cytoskeletal protein [Thermodesulfobacteriota bacterium]